MNKKRIVRIAQVMLATALTLTVTGLAEAENKPSEKIILVTPSELPELARVPGQAMLLYETEDGRTLLYIEQDQGARLAIFDVTDPVKIDEKTAVQLDAPGPFDFVSSLGAYSELIRFQNGQGDALLDLHKVESPSIETVQGLDVQGSIQRLGVEGFIIANQPNPQSDAADANYQLVDISNADHPNLVADVNQVIEKITNDETGTTYLLAKDGLYIVRRPSIEQEYDIHRWQLSHPG
jgi:hypothetical protein